MSRLHTKLLQRFNPRAPRGARRIRCGMARTSSGFNPRAPRGARHLPSTQSLAVLSFNPRAPRGARLYAAGGSYNFNAFQSTRPAWGATLKHILRWWPRTVSIHAPRVGRDRERISRNVICALFQSTRPAWGATTPLLATNTEAACFNPRAPRGARRAALDIRLALSRFNPRAPRGARRRKLSKAPWSLEVSIHAPRVGRDGQRSAARAYRLCFNPRAPRGARHRTRRRF